MRKISEIFCDLIFANWEIHCVEHVKMGEFDKGETMDKHLVAEMDKIMRKQSEKRKAMFNELNDVFEKIIKEKEYDFVLESTES